ncbi:alcohol dehydrogenase [Gracilaria domingensis]|nr:alcohol dehydrogenase [Gracilaria domingensis]
MSKPAILNFVVAKSAFGITTHASVSRLFLHYQPTSCYAKRLAWRANSTSGTFGTLGSNSTRGKLSQQFLRKEWYSYPCRYRKKQALSTTSTLRVRMSASETSSTRWVTHSYGDVGNLKLEEFVPAQPVGNEVRIRVRAIGLNFADVIAVLGFYTAAGDPPFCPGFEISGVVDAVGENVTQFAPNDRVYALVRFGAYTTSVNVDYRRVRSLPSGWSFEEGAAFGAQVFTAWYSLCALGGIPSNGERPLLTTSERKVVLVHSAAGGVGLNLVKMVQKVGGEVVAVVGSERKIGTLQDHGIDREHIIVRGQDDRDGFEEAVRKILGGDGVDVVVDSLLGDYFDAGYRLLNRGGRYILMGSASIVPSGTVSILRGGLKNLIQLGWKFLRRPKLDLLSTIDEGKTISSFNLVYYFNDYELLERGFSEIEAMQLAKPTVGKTYRFKEAPDALRYFQSGQNVGKIVLTVDDES